MSYSNKRKNPQTLSGKLTQHLNVSILSAIGLTLKLMLYESSLPHPHEESDARVDLTFIRNIQLFFYQKHVYFVLKD